jgi:hydrogenase nickel incorporation protein HypA/HybF
VGFSLQLHGRTFLHFVLSCFVFFLAAVIFRLGALSHISPAHRREHFEAAATGTIAEAARLDIGTLRDERGPSAQDILLHSVEVEE